MLVPAEQLTGYVRQDCQIRWLKEYGFVHGRDWWQQKKNGKIVVLMAESKAREPEEKPDLSSFGPKAHTKQTPAAKAVHSARKVSAKAT